VSQKYCLIVYIRCCVDECTTVFLDLLELSSLTAAVAVARLFDWA